MGARRRASLLLPLLLLLLQAAACVSELHHGAQPVAVPVADESGQGVDARDSVVSISVTGVEHEVRCRRQQAARCAALCWGAADEGCRLLRRRRCTRTGMPRAQLMTRRLPTPRRASAT
jgi:hypothetical protein